jgi:E3 ubiquitin-protein ligase MARCH6
MLVRGIDHIVNSPLGSFFEPYFAALGKRVRLNSQAIEEAWVELANGDGSLNRAFAVAVGYSLIFLSFAIYLNILNVGSVQSAGRAIRNAIKQQLVVLKVVVFILIELAFFPLGCGIMLDLYTMELFPSTTLQTRFAFFRYAPTTSIFYHWIIGTMFM